MVKVLIVDGHEGWRERAESALGKLEGVELICVGSREEALAQLAGVQVVVTSSCLPHRGDGAEVVREAYEKGIRVIALSATPGEFSFVRGQCSAVFDKLKYDETEFVTAVAEALNP